MAMSPKTRMHAATAVLCVAMLGCALVAAPRSCDGGLEAYLLAGLIGVPAIFAVPLLLRTDRSTPRRLGLGLVLAGIGAAVWVLGLVGANFRILCRLF